MTDALPTDSTTLLTPGDTLATAGDWPGAIAAWERAARERPELRPAVERRLAWFLDETKGGATDRGRILPLVLVFLAAVALGTAFLALAGAPGSAGADAWAVATWVMVAVAIACALTLARRSGEPPLNRHAARARAVATRLAQEPARGETP